MTDEPQNELRLTLTGHDHRRAAARLRNWRWYMGLCVRCGSEMRKVEVKYKCVTLRCTDPHCALEREAKR